MSQRKNISISGALVLTVSILISILAVSNLADAAGTPTGTDIINMASSTYEDANSNSYTADSNDVTTTIQSVYSVSVNAPANQSGNSNTVVDYAYTVTNTSNANNTFALSCASGAGAPSWTCTLYADDGTGDGDPNDGVRHVDETTVTASSGSIAADTTYKFFVAVTIPADTADNQPDDTDLTITGSGDTGAGDDTSDTVTTTAKAPALEIVKNVRNTGGGAFATTANADPTDTLEYRIKVTNNTVNSITATNVVLTDDDHDDTTYKTGNLRIGSDTTCSGNALKSDTNSGDSACAVDACGAASFDGSGNLTAYLGNGATESAGGSLDAASIVYVCFQVTVD